MDYATSPERMSGGTFVKPKTLQNGSQPFEFLCCAISVFPVTHVNICATANGFVSNDMQHVFDSVTFYFLLFFFQETIMVGLISSITILASQVITLEPSQTPAVSMLSFLLFCKNSENLNLVGNILRAYFTCFFQKRSVHTFSSSFLSFHS